jgi:hypothetical protein
MVQPTNQRELYDAPHLRRLHRTLLGRVLAERQMGAAGVIVLTNESPKQPSQVPLVPDGHMLEAFSPQSADHAFRIWILPRRPSRHDHFLDAQMLDAIPKDRAVDAIPVAQQVPVVSTNPSRRDSRTVRPNATGWNFCVAEVVLAAA